jgi:hypothetical protein
MARTHHGVACAARARLCFAAAVVEAGDVPHYSFGAGGGSSFVEQIVYVCSARCAASHVASYTPHARQQPQLAVDGLDVAHSE